MCKLLCDCGAEATTRYGPSRMCQRCRNDFPKAYHSEATRAERTETQRNLRNKRQKAKLCIDCGRKRGSRSRCYCDLCAEKDLLRKRVRNLRHRKRGIEPLEMEIERKAA